MAEGGQLPSNSPATPTLKELSDALDSVVDWHPLGVKLGMKAHELATIEKNYRGDNERCKHEMLTCCLRSGGLQTWKTVTDALCLMGEHDIALKIRAKYCSSSADTDTVTPSSVSQVDPSTVAIAQRNIQMINGKFSTLVTKSRRKLQRRKIDVGDVQMFLITLLSSPNSKDGDKTVTTVVESARNLNEIFRALSKYGLWNYLNYYLLQSIIVEFAGDDKELKGMMKQYQKDLTGHILTLEIQTYLDATHCDLPLVTTNNSEDLAEKIIPALPPQQKCKLFQKLTVKVKTNVTDHTLIYVNDLWQSLASQFALPRPAMILHNIAEGCLGITWLIPTNLVQHVTRMARETGNMFAKERILRVMLEDQCLYPMETNPPLPEIELSSLETNPPLLETEPSPSKTVSPKIETALKRKVGGFSGERSLDINVPARSTEMSKNLGLPTTGNAYSMGSNFSYQILEQHSNEIQQAIEFDLTQLVNELVVVNLIDMGMKNGLFDDPDADAATNSRRLLTVVKGKVKQNPADFDKFTGALRESNQIKLAEKLERARKHLKKFPVPKWWTMLALGIVMIAVATTTLNHDKLQLPIPSSPSPLPQIPCAKLQVPNGHVSLNEMEKGGTVQATIFCEEGFILKGKDTLTYTKSGKWDGDVPNCIRINCGPPPQIQDGNVDYDDTGYDSRAEYRCREGFLLVGSSMMVCQSDGKTAKWSALDDTDSAPLCKPMKCPDLGNPMYGRINVTKQTLGSTAEYMCIDGYKLTGGNHVRICLAWGNWSGKAPLCEFGGEDKIAHSIQRKTNRLQEIAWLLKGQSTTAQALEDISSNLAKGKLQAGMVGLMKSGKSSVLNALMRSATLPVAIQAETAVEVRIIHSNKYEHRNGVLYGEKDDGSHEVIARGSDQIQEELRKFNEINRNKSMGEELPHEYFVLHAPFHFLDEIKLKFSLQISDTAGPNEAGAPDATMKSKEAMKRLSAFIIVLNYRVMKTQEEIDLLTHLRDHHSHLLETPGRFLFVVNAIDAYYEDGNKYSVHPQNVPSYVQEHLKQNLGVAVPLESIVPITAKWALKSQLWSENLTSMTDREYLDALNLFYKCRDEEPQKPMRVPSENNKLVVVNGLNHFSKIGGLESILFQMLGINGPEILYKGAIDDAVLHVGTLTKHIEEEKVNCNIGATETDLQLQKAVQEELDSAITANRQKIPLIPLEVENKIGKEINSWTFDLTNSVSKDMQSLAVQLNEQNLRRLVLDPAGSKMEKFWPTIMDTTIGTVKEKISAMLLTFKRDLEKRLARFDGIELECDEIDYSKLEPTFPPFSLVLSVPADLDLDDTARQDDNKFWNLALGWAVQFQEKVKAEVTRLSFETANLAEKATQKSVIRFRMKIQKEILRLRDELESKQKFIESLNQKLNELQTVSDQLKDEYDKIENSLLDEIE